MAAFEFGNYPERPGRPPFAAPGPTAPQAEPAQEAATLALPAPTRSEPILALKIYDSCRAKNCLTPADLGPALCLNGEPVQPPENAQSVSIENLHISRITILSKEASKFRRGFWDIEVQYDFDYLLRFTSRGGKEITSIPATNSFAQRVSLFGSVGSEVAMATDLVRGVEATMSGEPFVLVEAKAIGLAAEIRRNFCHNENPRGHGSEELDGFEGVEQLHHHHRNRDRVLVTIGLFSMIKLFRLVSLLVESRGFVIPDKCRNILPQNPCDFFEELDFPMDSFSPPQRREFMSGESINIPGRPCLARTDAEIEEIAEE